MDQIKSIIGFGWPFIRRYRTRLYVGILLCVFYGAFNASFVWGTKTLFERLEPATERKIASPESDLPFGFKSNAFEKAITLLDQRVDAWLPKSGEPLNIQRIMGGLLFLPILVAIRGGIGYASAYFLGWAGENTVKDVRVAVHQKLQSLSFDFFHGKSVGDHTMLINRGTGSLQRCLTFGIADSIKEPFTIVSIVVALFLLDWQLALFGIVLVPLSAVPIVIVGRKLRRMAKITYSRGVEQDSLMMEAYTNIKNIKAYGLESFQISRFREIYGILARVGMKTLQARQAQNPIIEVMSMVGAGVIIIFVFQSGKAVPEFVGFLTGMIMLYQPIKKLGGVNQYYQEASVGVEMLRNVFDQVPSVQEQADAKQLAPIDGQLTFEGVGFSYTDEVVLRDFDLVLSKGMKIGVVGESGAGKSTLVSLLLRFYDPTKGRVTIDGTDIREVTFESLRGQMALVSQEVVIFDQTVAENIACGKLDASREEIVTAAKAANAHEFIEGLPEGYDTRLGEQGTRLSGGQRQRIAIARAFVRQAPILILDEATAALDSKAEAEVQGAIDRLEEGRTVVCVAHRLSTLRGMDKIIVLEEGRVVEEGGFAELLERDGMFAEMARKQGLATS